MREPQPQDSQILHSKSQNVDTRDTQTTLSIMHWNSSFFWHLVIEMKFSLIFATKVRATILFERAPGSAKPAPSRFSQREIPCVFVAYRWEVMNYRGLWGINLALFFWYAAFLDLFEQFRPFCSNWFLYEECTFIIVATSGLLTKNVNAFYRDCTAKRRQRGIARFLIHRYMRMCILKQLKGRLKD